MRRSSGSAVLWRGWPLGDEVPLVGFVPDEGKLVGRDREQERIRHLIDTVAAGEKRSLLLCGEAGVGKTALLAHAAAMAAEGGVCVATVRAPVVSGVPHAPVVDLFEGIRSALAERRMDPPRALLTAIDTMRGRRPDERPAIVPMAAEALERAADRLPVLLCVDDVDRLTLAEAAWLVDLVAMADGPIGLILTARDPAAVGPNPTGALVIDPLPLERLERPAVGELAEGILGAPLLPSGLDALMPVALGNPLFTLEVLRSWGEAGVVTGVGGHASVDLGGWEPPTSLTALIDRRLSRTSGEERTLICTVALIGRPATADELNAVLGVSLEQLDVALDRTIAEGIVEVIGEAPVRFRLAHSLYEGRIVEGMSQLERARIHERILTGLRDPQSDVGAAFLARHALRALRAPEDIDDLVRAAAIEALQRGDARSAAEWWGIVAERTTDPVARAGALGQRAGATAAYDARAAVEVFDQALAASVPMEHRADLLLGRAGARRRAGSPADALVDLDQALAIAPPAEQRRIRSHQARIVASQGRIDLAERLVIDLRDELPDDDEPLTLADLAGLRYAQGDLGEAARLINAALQQADGAAARGISGNEMWLRMLIGDWDGALRIGAALIAQADRAGDFWNLVSPLSVTARINAWRGAIGPALDAATRAIRVAERIGNPADLADALESLAVALLESGRPHEAVAVADRIGQQFDGEMEYRPDHAATLVVAGDVHLQSGDSVTARRFASRAREHVGRTRWDVAVDRLEGEIRMRVRDREHVMEWLRPWLQRVLQGHSLGYWVLEAPRTAPVAG